MENLICKPTDYRKTRIIATIGPASSDVETIRSLMRAGADCFRVNFSHGDGKAMQPLIDNIREAEKLEGVAVPILADIQGPKIRIGKLPIEGVTLKEGGDFTITIEELDGPGNEKIVQTSYKQLPNDVLPGSRILLADGSIELRAEQIKGNKVHCKVVTGGTLFSNKGINLPETRLSVETLTEKDRQDLQYISKADIDIVAISFVRSPHDLIRAQTLISNDKIPIVAKLERPEALDVLDEILEVSDGVMVARGDLGVEISFEKVPILQKRILERASQRGKWAVVATQMLGSMVLNSRPTRAEVSDVSNAVLEGADSVMLSEETAVGNHVVLAVQSMHRIVQQSSCIAKVPTEMFEADIDSFSAAAAGAAVNAAERLKASAIVVVAGSGTTALLLSKWRPAIPIISLSNDSNALRRSNVLRGVIPVRIDGKWDMEKQLSIADEYLQRHSLAKPGDHTIVVAAMPLGSRKETNTIRFHKVRNV